MRSWFGWIAILTFVGIVGLCAGVIGVGLWLSSPVQATVGAPPDDLNAETIEFASSSGATIRGWFVAGQPGHGAVVLMHGVHANRLFMVRRARLLSAQGFAVLLFDFQAHGESTGTRITFGHLEGRDAAAAVAFMRQRAPGERIGVIGSSLGGAAALLAPGGLHVDAMVLESVYPDIGSATANRINAVLGAPLGPIVAKPVARLFELLMTPILGATSSDLRPIDRMADVNAAVLVISGTSDASTTPEETSAMFERARPPKYIWLIQGAGHVDAEQYGLEAYHARVFGFLSERLRQPWSAPFHRIVIGLYRERQRRARMPDMRLIVAGAGGRMGRTLIKAIAETPGLILAGATEGEGSALLGQDSGVLAGLPPNRVPVTSEVRPLALAADAILDFTVPAATVKLVALAAETHLIHIIGTTGMSPADDAIVAEAAKKTAIVKSGNMSLGVNLLGVLTKKVAQALGEEFDIEIFEMHHNKKIDAPSGTALLFGEAAAAGRGIELATHSERGRDGHPGARKVGSIGFASLRGGTVAGEHHVIFAGPDERVELVHKATDRMIFARGALKAAQWARGRPPGLYSMLDVLGLKD